VAAAAVAGVRRAHQAQPLGRTDRPAGALTARAAAAIVAALPAAAARLARLLAAARSAALPFRALALHRSPRMTRLCS
jgi:hypothetical protein